MKIKIRLKLRHNEMEFCKKEDLDAADITYMKTFTYKYRLKVYGWSKGNAEALLS